MDTDAQFGDDSRCHELLSSVRYLLDRAAIIDLMHRYSYYTDHRMHAAVVDLFAEDCVVDYGPAFGPPVEGRPALRAMYASHSGDDEYYIASSHHNANILVTFEGPDRARVRTSLYVWHRTRDGKNPEIWGYYYDIVERGTAGWRFATRQLRVGGTEGFAGECLPLAFGEEP